MRKLFNLLLIPFFAFFFMNDLCNPKPCDSRKLIKLQKDIDEQKECKLRNIIVPYILSAESNRLSSEPEPNNSFEDAKCIDFEKQYNSIYISGYDWALTNSTSSKDKDYFFTNIKNSNFKVMKLKDEQTGILFKVYTNKENKVLISPIITQFELTSRTNGKKYMVQLEEYNANAETFIYLLLEAPTKEISVSYFLTKQSPLNSDINADEFYNQQDGSPMSHFYFEGDFTCSP